MVRRCISKIYLSRIGSDLLTTKSQYQSTPCDINDIISYAQSMQDTVCFIVYRFKSGIILLWYCSELLKSPNSCLNGWWMKIGLKKNLMMKVLLQWRKWWWRIFSSKNYFQKWWIHMIPKDMIALGNISARLFTTWTHFLVPLQIFDLRFCCIWQFSGHLSVPIVSVLHRYV